MGCMKECSVCRVHKALSGFYERPDRPGTYRARCRECTRARVSNHYFATRGDAWGNADQAPAHRAWQAVDRRMSSTPAANGPRYLIGAMG